MEQYFDLLSRNSESLLNFIVNSSWAGLLFAGLVWMVLYFSRRIDAASKYRIWVVATIFIVVAPIAMSPIPASFGELLGKAFAENEEPFVPSSNGGLNFAVAGESSEKMASPNAGRAEAVNEGDYRRATGSYFSGVSMNSRFAAARAFNASKSALSSGRVGEILLGLFPISVISIWSLFSLCLLTRLGRGYFEVAGIKKGMSPLRPLYARMISDIIRSSGARRKATVGVSPLVQIPVSIGFFRPVIIFPEKLIDRLSFDEIRIITLHELAHIQRYDDWSNLFQKLVQAVLFFHPAVIMIGRKMDLEREIACDEWVVANTGRPKQYARTLTRLVQLTTESWNPALASGAALFKKQLFKRLESILSSGKKKRSPISRLRSFGLVTALALTVVLVVQITPVIALPGNAVSFYELSSTIKEGWREASAYIPGVIYDDQVEENDDYRRARAIAFAPESSSGTIKGLNPVRAPRDLIAFSRNRERGEAGTSVMPVIMIAPTSLPKQFIVQPDGVVWQDNISGNKSDTESRFRYQYDVTIGGGKFDYRYNYNSDTVGAETISPDELPAVIARGDFHNGDLNIAGPDGSIITLSGEQLTELAALQGAIAAKQGALAAIQGKHAAKEAKLDKDFQERLTGQFDNLTWKELEHLSEAELADLFTDQAELYADFNENWVSDLADAAGELLSGLENSNTLSIDDENNMTWSYRDGGRKVRIEVDGEIKLTDDDRWIEALEEGGFISIFERKDGHTRKFGAENRSGELRLSYFENRERAEIDDRAREWVGDMLIDMVRRSGIGAEARLKRIYDMRGFEGVIDELEELKSGHVTRKYVAVLFEYNLSESEKLRVLALIPNLFLSDYDRAELLIDIGEYCETDDELLAGYMNATRDLSSDYETRRVLSAISLEGTSDPRVMELALEIAMEMSSDFDKAEYLIDLARENDNRFDLSKGFLDALESISSSYEKGRVLKSLIISGEISQDYVGEVLRFADNLESDYDKAELLIFSAKNLGIDEKMFELYVDAISQMSSDYDIKRTLFALGSMERAGDMALIKIFNLIDYMDSDYDKAELLIGFAHQAMRSEETGRAYLRALEDIHSDYDMSRVFASLLERNDLTGDFILGSLLLIEEMSGDYDKAQVLKKMMNHCRGDEELEDAYADAIETISSSHEKERLYAELYRRGRDKN